MREVRNRYEIFLKVCETGSFTKAAEALNYTQSGISQMMAGLEEELGVQLFARAKKVGVQTDNGQRLIPCIREMVNQQEKLRQADAVTFGGQTLFSFPAVCGRKEVTRVQKKAFQLFVCTAVLLYIFCIKAR